MRRPRVPRAGARGGGGYQRPSVKPPAGPVGRRAACKKTAARARSATQRAKGTDQRPLSTRRGYLKALLATQEPNPLRNRNFRVGSGYQRLSYGRYWVERDRLRRTRKVLGRFLRGGPPARRRRPTCKFGFRLRPPGPSLSVYLNALRQTPRRVFYEPRVQGPLRGFERVASKQKRCT